MLRGVAPEAPMVLMLALFLSGCSSNDEELVSKPTEEGATQVEDTAPAASTGPFAELEPDETWFVPGLQGDGKDNG